MEQTGLIVGLVLGALFLGLVLIGDKRLAALFLFQRKEALPELAPTALLRPLASFAFAGWIMYAVMDALIVAFGSATVWLGLLGWFLSAVVFAIYWKGYAWRPPFKGIQINVREPRVKFPNMDYTFDPADLGYSVFLQMFWLQFSALLIRFELGIHESMGNDKQRVQEEDGDCVACEGMMAQEINHGKCQLLYSRHGEKAIAYPAGYRRLWSLFFRYLPQNLSMAFVAYLESGFIVLTGALADNPWLYDRAYSQPKWVYAWHGLEESEHCWESAQDMMERTDIVSRLIMWILGGLLVPIQILPLSFIEGIAYGHRALFRSPETFLWSIAMLLFFAPNFFMVTQACCFLHTICGLRPSDESYSSTRDRYYSVVFGPYEKDFRVTHVQEPLQILRRRQSSIVPRRGSVAGMLRSSLMRMSSKDIQSPQGSMRRLSVKDCGSVRRLSTYRASLYQETQNELRKAGMSQEEIDDAGFGLGNSSSFKRLSMAPNAIHELELLASLDEDEEEDESKKDM